MAKKEYDWKQGAILEDHTKKKHEILQQYFHQYLVTRCQLPKQEKFRLVIVDAFSGAGYYQGGHFGSPLIFIDTLKKATDEINISRIEKGVRPIQIECLLMFNDMDKAAIAQLQKNITPHVLSISENGRKLHVKVEYLNDKFETLYPYIKKRIGIARCGNVFFNLDQCGYSHVNSRIIRDIISSWKSAEVILTFMITSMLAFLSPSKGNSKIPIEPEIKAKIDAILADGNLLGKQKWLGKAEKVVYSLFKGIAPFVSPFSIHNPDGWRYWLMHFANSHRARQVYNDILHQDGKAQAHFGRAGLKMLSYSPQEEGNLYLFDNDSRELAKEELHGDIPRLISEQGDTLGVYDFYKIAYSETPAHSDDIHKAILSNPDIEVLTDTGGTRRNTIKPDDTLRLKSQKSLIFMFPKK